jgi:YjbE family integral membrane protein
MESIATAIFWIALAKIIWVNILLSGDNAVVIALASRNLPAQQQRNAIIFGSVLAIVLRVGLTVFAVQLLQYPYLRVVGGLLLLWCGIQLLIGDDDDPESHGVDKLFVAIRTIVVADLIMSLDNVIGVAGAAESGPPEARVVLLIIGLVISIPLIIFGSKIMLTILQRFPAIITLGAALLGFVAGEMIMTDTAVVGFLGGEQKMLMYVAAAIGAIFVVGVGKWLDSRRGGKESADAE